ncbi:MAG: hypothetical protein JO304_12975 [Solirubrobacterales bacterium]|nr:hypothetical protein [Solirubrobacterales bacterium]
MDSVVGSAASTAGGAVPRPLLEAMQRQVDLLQEVIERERSVQKQVAAGLVAPVDAVFDLLEQIGMTLRRQAEALETAGQALEETARLAQNQAELYERTIRTLREPAEIAKSVVGLERKTRTGGTRQARAQRPERKRPRA